MGSPARGQPEPVAPAASSADTIRVVSFNIQFLGQFKKRNNEALADLLAPYDLVVVQELVAPPYSGEFPDGSAYRPDKEARAFFDAMNARGFAYVLSPEDTGTSEQQHVNSSATEWFVTFYKPGRLTPADDLPSGFLGEDRFNHPDFERVPYAFGFRAGSEDLVFISVHLQPGSGSTDVGRRAHELGAISQWIDDHDDVERDFVILGDMNIEDCAELAAVLPIGYESLNSGCLSTNTNVNGPKPYDHVMIRPADSAPEIPFHFTVISLVEAMRPYWSSTRPYPGDPYVHDAFRQVYSDHNPVEFEIQVDGIDDD